MKLAQIILILIIIQGTIIMYDQVFADDYDLISYGDNETTIWSFATNPAEWSSSSFIVTLLALVSVTGAIGIGVYLYTKSDTILFFSIFELLIGVGMVPIISLYQVFTRDITMFGCEVGGAVCTNGIIAWVFTGGILAILYILACLEWWSGRAT